MTTVAKLLEQTTSFLEKHKVESPRLTAELMLAHVLGRKQLDLYLESRGETSPKVILAIQEMAKRRADGEPLQYITGMADFCGLQIEVDPRVLIPRPETELLVEAIVRVVGASFTRDSDHMPSRLEAESARRTKLIAPAKLAARRSPLGILDLCTGSGCVAIALAKQLPQSRITAVDISEDALVVARANAIFHGVQDTITFVRGDMFSPLRADETFDAIVSNPPYVSLSAYESLQREIREHEPLTALVSGRTGLEVIEKIIRQAKNFLLSSGQLALEIGFDQRERVSQLLGECDYKEIEFVRDLQGHSRVAVARKSD